MTHVVCCAAQEAKGRISDQLMQRLKLKPEKIKQLAQGLRSIAAQEEPIGKTLSRIEVSPNVVGIRGLFQPIPDG